MRWGGHRLSAKVYDDVGTYVFGPYPSNGYEEEWRHLAGLAGGIRQDPAELDAMIEELSYAIDIADRCVASLAEGSGR